MARLVNRAQVSTSTTGTGTVTLGAALPGFRTFAAAGIADGDEVRYVIEDGANWEIGVGTYSSAGPTMARLVEESSNSNSAISLSGAARVYVAATAADLQVQTASQWELHAVLNLTAPDTFATFTDLDPRSEWQLSIFGAQSASTSGSNYMVVQFSDDNFATSFSAGHPVTLEGNYNAGWAFGEIEVRPARTGTAALFRSLIVGGDSFYYNPWSSDYYVSGNPLLPTRDWNAMRLAWQFGTFDASGGLLELYRRRGTAT